MRFRLVDRILEVQAAERIRAEVTFAPSEELFLDHFPGRPLVPGSLLVEAMAQAGGWLVLHTDGFRRWPLLVLVEHAKFREPTPPGGAIELTAELSGPLRGASVRVTASAHAGGRAIARASCVYRLFEPAEIAPGDGAAEEFRRWVATTWTELLESPAPAR